METLNLKPYLKELMSITQCDYINLSLLEGQNISTISDVGGERTDFYYPWGYSIGVWEEKGLDIDEPFVICDLNRASTKTDTLNKMTAGQFSTVFKNIKSCAITPIFDKNLLIGYLSVNKNTPNFYTNEIANIIQSYVEGTQEIKYAILFNRLYWQIDLYKKFSSIQLALSYANNIEKICTIITREFRELSSANASYCYIRTDHTNFKLMFSKKTTSKQSFAQHHQLIKQTCATKKACLYNSNNNELLSIPILNKDHCIAIVILENKAVGTFGEIDKRVLMLLSDVVATSLYRIESNDELIHLAKIHERQVIAQELHDSIAQELFAAGMEVDKLLSINTNNTSTHTSLNYLEALINRCTLDTRNMILELRSPIQKIERNMILLIVEMLDELKSRYHIDYRFDHSATPFFLTNIQSNVVISVIRESLNNIRKHSKASFVVVSLHQLNATISLTIQDNGIGILDLDSTKIYKSFLHCGFQNMINNVAKIKGKFSIKNSKNGGLIVSVTFLKGDFND